MTDLPTMVPSAEERAEIVEEDFAQRRAALGYGRTIENNFIVPAIRGAFRDGVLAGIELCATYHAAQTGNPMLRAREADAIRAIAIPLKEAE